MFMVMANDSNGPGACVHIQVHVSITGVVMLSAMQHQTSVMVGGKHVDVSNGPGD